MLGLGLSRTRLQAASVTAPPASPQRPDGDLNRVALGHLDASRLLSWSIRSAPSAVKAARRTAISTRWA